MWVDKYKHMLLCKDAHSCNCKNLFRHSLYFGSLQTMHILKAVPSMRKPFSTGLSSPLSADSSACSEKLLLEKSPVVVLRLKPTGKQKSALWESTGRKGFRQHAGNGPPFHDYILWESIQSYSKPWLVWLSWLGPILCTKNLYYIVLLLFNSVSKILNIHVQLNL